MLTTSTYTGEYTPIATEDSRLREELLATQTASSKMRLHPQSSSAQCRQPRLKKAHSEITWNYVIFAFTFFASLMAASAANGHAYQSIYRAPLHYYHRRLAANVNVGVNCTKEDYESLPEEIVIMFPNDQTLDLTQDQSLNQGRCDDPVCEYYDEVFKNPSGSSVEDKKHLGESTTLRYRPHTVGKCQSKRNRWTQNAGENLNGTYKKTNTPPAWANTPADKLINFAGSDTYNADDTDSWSKHAVGSNLTDAKWYLKEGSNNNIVIFYNLIQQKWYFCGNHGLYYRANNRKDADGNDLSEDQKGSMTPLPKKGWYFEETPYSLSMYRCKAGCTPIQNNSLEKKLKTVQCHSPDCKTYGVDIPAFNGFNAKVGTGDPNTDNCVCKGDDERSDMFHHDECPNTGLPNSETFEKVPKVIYATGQGTPKAAINCVEIIKYL